MHSHNFFPLTIFLQLMITASLFGCICILMILPFIECSNSEQLSLSFGMMCYQKQGHSDKVTYDHFMRMYLSIYDESVSSTGLLYRHSYVLHVDSKTEVGLSNHLCNVECGPDSLRKNCRCIEQRNVGWAGLSTAEMMLALMQSAFDDFRGVSSAWDYFILIGHESMALYSTTYIIDYLDRFPRGTNFMNCWDVSHYNFFGQWEDGSSVVGEVYVENFNGGMDPVNVKRSLPPDVKLFKSIQLVVLAADFVRYVIRAADTRRVMVRIANTISADEILIPTLLQRNPAFRETATCETTLHFTHWIRPGASCHPEYLSLEHLPLIMNSSQHLFARKLDFRISKKLVEAIQQLRNDVDDFIASGGNWEIQQVQFGLPISSSHITQISNVGDLPGFAASLPLPLLHQRAFVESHVSPWLTHMAMEYFFELCFHAPSAEALGHGDYLRDAISGFALNATRGGIQCADVLRYWQCIALTESHRENSSLGDLCNNRHRISVWQVVELLDDIRRFRDALLSSQYFSN